MNETQNITIHCSHDDGDLDIMLWYQQKINSEMALIGYSYGMNEPNNEDNFKDRFKQSREDTQNGKLTISNVLQPDSAVYYCAAREHSATDSHHLLTKSPKHTSTSEYKQCHCFKLEFYASCLLSDVLFSITVVTLSCILPM